MMHFTNSRARRSGSAFQIAMFALLASCAGQLPDAPAAEGDKLYLAETPGDNAAVAADSAIPQTEPFADGEFSIDSSLEPAANEGEFDKARSCYVDLQWCRNPAGGACNNIPLCRTYGCQDRAENPNNDQVGRYCTSLIRQVCGNVGRYCYTKN